MMPGGFARLNISLRGENAQSSIVHHAPYSTEFKPIVDWKFAPRINDQFRVTRFATFRRKASKLRDRFSHGCSCTSPPAPLGLAHSSGPLIGYHFVILVELITTGKWLGIWSISRFDAVIGFHPGDFSDLSNYVTSYSILSIIDGENA
jgi:hypothetical protein